jgi:hypothetical protein
VALASLAVLIVMWLLPFQVTGLPEDSVSAIANRWWPFRAAYGLVLTTTLLCTIARIQRDWVRATRWRELARTVRRRRPIASVAGDMTAAADSLSAAGFQVHGDEGVVVAVRRPWAVLGGSVMHLSIVGLAVGLAIHAATYSTTTFRLIEGESMAAAQGQGLPAEERALRRSVSDATLRSIEPSYFRDVLLFSRLDATWSRADGRVERFSLANPVWADPFTHVSVQDFGFAPHFVTRNASGATIDDAIPAMNVFPPGTQDEVDLRFSKLRVNAIVLPDYGVKGGRDVSLSYNLRNPRVVLTVSSVDPPKAVIARGVVRVGVPLRVQPSPGVDRTLTVTEIRRYGTFRISRSYGMPVLVLFGLLLVVGLGVRILGRRVDVVLWEEGGAVVCDAHLDMEGRSEALSILRNVLGDTLATEELL